MESIYLINRKENKPLENRSSQVAYRFSVFILKKYFNVSLRNYKNTNTIRYTLCLYNLSVYY